MKLLRISHTFEENISNMVSINISNMFQDMDPSQTYNFQRPLNTLLGHVCLQKFFYLKFFSLPYRNTILYLTVRNSGGVLCWQNNIPCIIRFKKYLPNQIDNTVMLLLQTNWESTGRKKFIQNPVKYLRWNFLRK